MLKQTFDSSLVRSLIQKLLVAFSDLLEFVLLSRFYLEVLAVDLLIEQNLLKIYVYVMALGRICELHRHVFNLSFPLAY